MFDQTVGERVGLLLRMAHEQGSPSSHGAREELCGEVVGDPFGEVVGVHLGLQLMEQCVLARRSRDDEFVDGGIGECAVEIAQALGLAGALGARREMCCDDGAIGSVERWMVGH